MKCTSKLFLPLTEKRLPLIITLGGFRGGLHEERAKNLVNHGFATLALAYFGCEGLPSTLQEIPLEYFERVIDEIKQHPSIDSSRIGLWGISRGAELSLILGTLIPKKIQAIVATVPSSAVYGSILSSAPAWIYRGQPIAPNAPFPPLIFDPKWGKDPENALALTPFFLEGMKDVTAFTSSQIPVEKIQCPLLLISAENDQMWPSTRYSEQIMIRLKKSSIPCKHISYPEAGHAISSSGNEIELHPILKIWFAFGGNLRDNARAKIDAWEKTLKFFKCFLLYFAFSYFPSFAMQKTDPTPSLGVRTLEYQDVARDRPVVVELWYPTDSRGPIDIPFDSIWIHPLEVRDAPLRKQSSKYPLLLFSHGHCGTRRSVSWLAARMVLAGYVVAAVDHHGDTRSDFDLAKSLRFWERPRDITFTLDQLQEDLAMREIIDFAKVGFIGYSLGGMTGLSLAGAQAKNIRQVLFQLNRYSNLTSELIEQLDLSDAEKYYGDSRIKAMLLLSPAVYIYPSESLRQIQIPISLVALVGDEVLPHREHAYKLIQHLIPAKLKILRQEFPHNVFINPLSEVGRKVFNKTALPDYSFIHQEIGTFAIDAFSEMF